jgi:uncharacterized protein
MGSETYHEPLDLLTEKTRNMHRAIVSLKEELDAVDWYQQRAEACSDTELRGVLLHNRSEEIEHAMMVLEWIRRNESTFDENVGTYLRTQAPILEVERAQAARGNGGSSAAQGGAASPASGPSPSLGIGSLRARS